MILNEISTIHALDTALLAYLGRQNAVEVRDVAVNMVRKAAWDMFTEGGSRSTISPWRPPARAIMRPARLKGRQRSVKDWILVLARIITQIDS